MLTWLRKRAAGYYAAFLTGKGFMAFHQGRYEKAIRLLERAERYDPDLDVTKELAEARQRLTNPREAN